MLSELASPSKINNTCSLYDQLARYPCDDYCLVSRQRPSEESYVTKESVLQAHIVHSVCREPGGARAHAPNKPALPASHTTLTSNIHEVSGALAAGVSAHLIGTTCQGSEDVGAAEASPG